MECGGGWAHQKHNLFRARSAPIVGTYVCTPSLTSLTLANLLAERPISGIAFYLGIRRTPKNGGISVGNALQKSIFRPHKGPPSLPTYVPWASAQSANQFQNL